MPPLTFSDHQITLIKHLIESKIFLGGPPDTGGGLAGVGFLLHLLASRAPAESILVIVSLEH